MNSPSENHGRKSSGHDVVAGFPVRLLNPEVRKKDVSRLEFHSVGRQVVEMMDVEMEPPVMEVDTRLKEEVAALDAQLQREEVAARIEEAQRAARLGAREEWESELAERVAAEREMVLRTCEQFGRERARYFAGVEAEVVNLALAIATRVLHREAQLDPLLLVAAVRVALEKVAEDSGLVLRVPVEDVVMWRGVFEADADSFVKLVADENLSAGACVLDTNVGKVELGVSAQLAEIEKGFFDLLQQRPA